jgi:hypothetical protein
MLEAAAHRLISINSENNVKVAINSCAWTRCEANVKAADIEAALNAANRKMCLAGNE